MSKFIGGIIKPHFPRLAGSLSRGVFFDSTVQHTNLLGHIKPDPTHGNHYRARGIIHSNQGFFFSVPRAQAPLREIRAWQRHNPVHQVSPRMLDANMHMHSMYMHMHMRQLHAGNVLWQKKKSKPIVMESVTNRRKLRDFFKVMRFKKHLQKRQDYNEKVEVEDTGPSTTDFDEDDELPPGINPLTCALGDLSGFEDPVEVSAGLQEVINAVLRRVQVPKSTEICKRDVVDQIQQQANDLFGPEAKIVPVGSSVSGFNTVASDVDLQLQLGPVWEETVQKVNAINIDDRLTKKQEKEEDEQWFEEWGKRREDEPIEDYQVKRIKYMALRGLAGRIRHHLGFEVRKILRAQIPIIKVLPEPEDPHSLSQSTGLGCNIDIAVADRENVAKYTVEYLKIYAKLDVRVQRLVRIVKTWAKRRGLVSPYDGTLNSYAWLLMTLHVLQNVRPQIIPIIFEPEILHPAKEAYQEDKEDKRWNKKIRKGKVVNPRSLLGDDLEVWNMKRKVLDAQRSAGRLRLPREPIARLTDIFGEEYEVNFHTDVQAMMEWGDSNPENDAKLLLRFFAYYALYFDFKEHVISVRTGKYTPFEKSRLRRPVQRPYNGLGWAAYIEDPIDPTNNVGMSCTAEGMEKISQELIRACKLVQRQDASRVFISVQAEQVFEEQDEHDREAKETQQRLLRARYKGMEDGNKFIEALGGYPDEIKMEDIETDWFMDDFDGGRDTR